MEENILALITEYPFGFTCSECGEVIHFCLQCGEPLCFCTKYSGGFAPYEIWCVDCFD
jgi:hypothetical protein